MPPKELEGEPPPQNLPKWLTGDQRSDLRDHFAAVALPEVMRRAHERHTSPRRCAELAYEMAEAMLEERRRREMPFGF